MLSIGITKSEINTKKLSEITKAVQNLPDNELLIFYIFTKVDDRVQPEKVMPLLVSWIKAHSITEFQEVLSEVAAGITITGQLKQSERSVATEDIKVISAKENFGQTKK